MHGKICMMGSLLIKARGGVDLNRDRPWMRNLLRRYVSEVKPMYMIVTFGFTGEIRDRECLV